MAQAMERYEEALKLFRVVGSRLGEANVYQSIGQLLQNDPDPILAWERFDKALQIFREIGDRYSEAVTLLYAGRMWLRRVSRSQGKKHGAQKRAERLFARGLELARSLSHERLVGDFEDALKAVSTERDLWRSVVNWFKRRLV
jgi:tetratricopeptide (TPR) repeat protein